MKIKIEIVPTYEITYIRNYGLYGISNVETMEKLKNWAMSNQLLNDDSMILGIAHDNPEVTLPENCRYDACLVISKDYSIKDDHIKKGVINTGKYAIFTITHTAEAVQKAYSKIFTQFCKYGYSIDTERAIIERYETKLLKDCKCEICVPIQ
jgi:DNA gyrase inhibitor GyrI